MNFQLLSMSGAVAFPVFPFGQSLGVDAFSDRACGMYPFFPVPFGKMDTRVANVLPCLWTRFKVPYCVVRVISVFMMNVMAFGDRTVMLLPKPYIVGLAVAIFSSFASGCFVSFQRIASSFQSLKMKRAVPSRSNNFVAACNLADGTGRARGSICDLRFERIARSLESIVMKSAVKLAMSFAPAIGYRAWFSHGGYVNEEMDNSQAFIYVNLNYC